MLAGLGTDESGERGGKRGLSRRCVKFYICYLAKRSFEVFLYAVLYLLYQMVI